MTTLHANQAADDRKALSKGIIDDDVEYRESGVVSFKDIVVCVVVWPMLSDEGDNDDVDDVDDDDDPDDDDDDDHGVDHGVDDGVNQDDHGVDDDDDSAAER